MLASLDKLYFPGVITTHTVSMAGERSPPGYSTRGDNSAKTKLIKTSYVKPT